MFNSSWLLQASQLILPDSPRSNEGMNKEYTRNSTITMISPARTTGDPLTYCHGVRLQFPPSPSEHVLLHNGGLDNTYTH